MIIFLEFSSRRRTVLVKCVLRNTILITCVHWIYIVCFLRHLNERKQKMKEKRRSSEENASFGLMKGVYNLVMTKNYQ